MHTDAHGVSAQLMPRPALICMVPAFSQKDTEFLVLSQIAVAYAWLKEADLSEKYEQRARAIIEQDEMTGLAANLHSLWLTFHSC
jgi:hypothetical protein